MSVDTVSVLYFDLEENSVSKKHHFDYMQYIGGVGLSLKLLEDNFEKDPLIFSVGPFSGVYPYASKTCLMFMHGGNIKEYYLGGRLATALRFSGVSAVVINGYAQKSASLNISSDESNFGSSHNDYSIHPEATVLEILNEKLLIDSKFGITSSLPYRKFIEKGLKKISIIGDGEIEVFDYQGYQEAYEDLNEQINKVEVKPSTHISCSGCPVGCGFAVKGEVGTSSFLSHCLVSCTFADTIYTDIPTIYRGLSVLGYSYTHEDLEFLEGKILELKGHIYEKITDRKLETK